MIYFVIEPEVAGGFGASTTGNLQTRPPQLVKFNYEFDVWLGDPLLEAVSNFIVTDTLKESLIKAHPSGITFGDVEITKSGIFQELYPNRNLPDFFWLQITGEAGKDDFGITASGDLVVSKYVMNVLEQFELCHCGVSEYIPQ